MLLSIGLSRSQHQLWYPIPRALPPYDSPRRLSLTYTIGFPREDWSFSLGDFDKNASNWKLMLRSGCCTVKSTGGFKLWGLWFRSFDGGWPVGRHNRLVLWQGRHNIMWDRPWLPLQCSCQYDLFTTCKHLKPPSAYGRLEPWTTETDTARQLIQLEKREKHNMTKNTLITLNQRKSY